MEPDDLETYWEVFPRKEVPAPLAAVEPGYLWMNILVGETHYEREEYVSNPRVRVRFPLDKRSAVFDAKFRVYQQVLVHGIGLWTAREGGEQLFTGELSPRELDSGNDLNIVFTIEWPPGLNLQLLHRLLKP